LQGVIKIDTLASEPIASDTCEEKVIDPGWQTHYGIYV